MGWDMSPSSGKKEECYFSIQRWKMLTEQAIQEFLTSRGRLRPKTQREYQKHLALFHKSFPELPETPQPRQIWLNGLKRQRGNLGQELANETILDRLDTLRAFYKQISLWHPEIRNPIPLVRAPRLEKKAMRTFTNEELFRLFNLPLCPRDRALLTLLVDIGPRADECANLAWENVMPSYVVLRGKTGERTVPVSETTNRRLEALRNGASGNQPVFMGKRGPLGYMGIYKLVRHLCHQAGINGRRCSPHTFRHTFGTNYAAADGCDPKVLQDIMGHRDFKTTLRYIQNNPRRMAQNHQRCTPLKLVEAAAQWSFFDTSPVVKEAEEILERSSE